MTKLTISLIAALLVIGLILFPTVKIILITIIAILAGYVIGRW